jgi:hypothetical protein
MTSSFLSDSYSIWNFLFEILALKKTFVNFHFISRDFKLEFDIGTLRNVWEQESVKNKEKRTGRQQGSNLVQLFKRSFFKFLALKCGIL